MGNHLKQSFYIVLGILGQGKSKVTGHSSCEVCSFLVEIAWEDYVFTGKISRICYRLVTKREFKFLNLKSVVVETMLTL